jgi:Gas vesicle synthesis protein GvpL/GvpF
VLYLYAITDAVERPDVSGLHGAPVFAVRDGELTAIASDHDQLRLRPDEDELWAHEAVVEAVMERAAVLPMRIGSVVESSDALVSLLRERSSDFGQALDHVRGAVELAVRVTVDSEVPQSRTDVEIDPGPGTEYMLARLGRKVRTDEVGARVHASLCELARDHTPMSSSHERMSIRAAYLVDRDRVDAFTSRAEGLQDQIDGVTIVCTGPWPPYSFTSGGTS